MLFNLHNGNRDFLSQKWDFTFYRLVKGLGPFPSVGPTNNYKFALEGSNSIKLPLERVDEEYIRPEVSPIEIWPIFCLDYKEKEFERRVPGKMVVRMSNLVDLTIKVDKESGLMKKVEV